jgi:Flp pilus assembly protein TadD
MFLATLYTQLSIAVRLSLAAAAAIVFSLPTAHAQDSPNESTMPRTDRPQIVVTVRDTAGAPIMTAGIVKLLKDGMLTDEVGLAHGRAVFGSVSLGNYTLEIAANGYKSAQKDVNVSVSMPYVIDANLEREGASNAGEPTKPLLAPKAKEALDKSLKALGKNKLPEAEKYIAEAATLAPGHPDVLYVQGVLFLKQQKWDQAQTTLERASQMDPTNARSLSALGMAFEDQGKYDQAIAPLEKSVQLDAKDWEPQWLLGESYYHLQQYDQALKASQLAWTVSNGKDPRVALLVAKSLTAVGQYEDAAQKLRDVVKRYGDRPEAATAQRYLDRLKNDGKIHSN